MEAIVKTVMRKVFPLRPRGSSALSLEELQARYGQYVNKCLAIYMPIASSSTSGCSPTSCSRRQSLTAQNSVEHVTIVVAKMIAILTMSSMIVAIAMAAPMSSPSAELSRGELVACFEGEELLQVSVKEHDARTDEHNKAANAIEAENKELLALQKKALTDKTLRDTLPVRIDAFNARIESLNAGAAKLETEQTRINTRVVSHNEACSVRMVDAKVKEQALAEFRARKNGTPATSPAAAAPATATSTSAVGAVASFDAGLKAYDKGDHAQALQIWLPLAEQGKPSAQFNIAMMYEQGLGTPKDDVQAARWYVAAAKSGSATAQLKAGSMFETGQGVATDLGSASYWYGEASTNTASDAVDVRRQAKDRLAKLPKAHQTGSQEVVAFDGGRFVLRRAANKDCIIALQGEINHSATAQFASMISKAKAVDCPRPLVLLLESLGGDLDAGLQLSRSVREEGMRTVARYECASSCANIFLGGAERVLWGSRAVVGLHQIAYTSGFGKGTTTTCVGTSFDPSTVAMRRQLKLLVPQTADEIMRVVMATKCSDITWIKGDRALELQLATKLEAPNDDLFGPLEGRLAARP